MSNITEHLDDMTDVFGTDDVIVVLRPSNEHYCTFELNLCTQNRRPYILTFCTGNIMFLGCMDSSC